MGLTNVWVIWNGHKTELDSAFSAALTATGLKIGGGDIEFLFFLIILNQNMSSRGYTQSNGYEHP